MSVEDSADGDSRRRVAIVFDDGPIEACTPKLLAALARENTRVTFAYIGRNIVAHRDLALSAWQTGHEPINHSFTHPRFTSLDDIGIRREIIDTQTVIHSVTGIAPRWFWSPFGDWDARVAVVMEGVGLSHFPIQRFHFISTNDWQPSTSGTEIYASATTDIHDRTVLLFHEWRQESLAQLPFIIAKLKDEGCRFVTFTELAEAH